MAKVRYRCHFNFLHLPPLTKLADPPRRGYPAASMATAVVGEISTTLTDEGFEHHQPRRSFCLGPILLIGFLAIVNITRPGIEVRSEESV